MSLIEQFEDPEAFSASPFVDEGESVLEEELREEKKPVEKALPIFQLEKVKYNPQSLVDLVVSADILVLAKKNGRIVRLNLKSEDLEEIEVIRRSDEQIHKLFLDPTGKHLLISTRGEDNYYLNASWNKPKVISKMRGHLIQSVAWNKQNTDEMTTKEILVGTSKGKIFETVIEANEKAFMERFGIGGKEQSLKQVYAIRNDGSPSSKVSITGLAFETIPGSTSETRKYFIIVTAGTRIYQFIGGPTFEDVFSPYKENGLLEKFNELPGEDGSYGSLQLYSKYGGLPKNLAWLTDVGVFYGDLQFGSQGPNEDILLNTHLLTYDSISSTKSKPIALVLTEFHFIILYKEKLQAICYLNGSIAFEEAFPPNFEPKGLAYDSRHESAWFFLQNAIFTININEEDRNVWQLYLDDQKYNLALEYSKTPEQRDKVLSTQADHYFEKQNYRLAAICYAKTHKSFEEIALKFMSLPESNPLKAYLSHKLDFMKQSKNQDSTQFTLLATWLTEIYLDKLNSMQNDSKQRELYDALREEFEQFLKDFKDDLHKETTFNLISSHGRIDELLYFANLMEDHDKVITYHIQNSNYHEALEVLSQQANPELHNKYSPVLMHHIPHETVDMWIYSHRTLDPKGLIPALMRYNPKNNPPGVHENQAIRYLEYCIKNGNVDPAIHNYLLSLYVEQEDEGPLLNFLNQPESRIHFDLKYALRLCIKEKKVKSSIAIYSNMELFEEAVELALQASDIEMAKSNAAKLDEDRPLQKKLWLRIARHLLEKENNIKEAMELLSDADLKIEDILPFFPDFKKIDEFKDEICSSLEDYNQHIEQLKKEMEDATTSANLIRQDIKDLRNKYGMVRHSQKCELCSYPVMTREFYLFPCHHVFHSNCLLQEIVKHLGDVEKHKVLDLLDQIKNASLSSYNESERKKTITNDDNDGVNVVMSHIEKLREELDDIVASECLLCGELMIQSIGEPFINTTNDLDWNAIQSWSLRSPV